MSNNKYPGPDGLTFEFYCKFWDRIGSVLVEVFNMCYADLNLCESMKMSNTRLIFKKGDKKNVKKLAPDFPVEC